MYAQRRNSESHSQIVLDGFATSLLPHGGHSFPSAARCALLTPPVKKQLSHHVLFVDA